jgi:hypothetical protein
VTWVAWTVFGVAALLLVALTVWLAAVLYRFRRLTARVTSELRGTINSLLARAAALRTRHADSSQPEPLGR